MTVSVLVEHSQLNPSNLFSKPFKEEEKWWVMHTKPRCEKALARILAREQISYFLPQGQSKRKFQRRLVVTQLPLFPGYIFLRGTSQDRLTTLQTNKVVMTLNVDNQKQLQNELLAVYQLVCSGQELKAESRIQPGARVEVIHGSLTGLRGIVFRCDGVTRVIIEVNMLGRGVSVQVEDWMLQIV